ncbi:MAG: periplasmic heavy metal sensor [Pseudomonadota bacterium]
MSRKFLFAALFASLALNLFIGGALAGAKFAEHRPRKEAGEQRGGGRNPVMLAVRQLSPESQAAWRKDAAEGQALMPKMREARLLARETMHGFASPDFDKEAAYANFKRARGLEYEARLAMDRRLVDFAAGLPPEERAKFGEALGKPALGRGRPADRRGAALPDR